MKKYLSMMHPFLLFGSSIGIVVLMMAFRLGSSMSRDGNSFVMLYMAIVIPALVLMIASAHVISQSLTLEIQSYLISAGHSKEDIFSAYQWQMNRLLWLSTIVTGICFGLLYDVEPMLRVKGTIIVVILSSLLGFAYRYYGSNDLSNGKIAKDTVSGQDRWYGVAAYIVTMLVIYGITFLIETYNLDRNVLAISMIIIMLVVLLGTIIKRMKRSLNPKELYLNCDIS